MEIKKRKKGLRGRDDPTPETDTRTRHQGDMRGCSRAAHTAWAERVRALGEPFRQQQGQAVEAEDDANKNIKAITASRRSNNSS